MKGTYLGPKYNNSEITNYLNQINAHYQILEDKDLFKRIAKEIDGGKVIGWFNGPMEFGLVLLLFVDPRFRLFVSDSKKTDSCKENGFIFRSFPVVCSTLEFSCRDDYNFAIDLRYINIERQPLCGRYVKRLLLSFFGGLFPKKK